MTAVEAHDPSVIPADVIAGELRRSINNSHDAKGSIHDDATATKLGFRGGTVAGSIHMELFPPLLIEAFGDRWFERGTLSMYFLNATTDREAVRAYVTRPPADARDAQVEVWVLREDGMRVAEGTASVGNPDAKSALLARPLDRFEPGELKILHGVTTGTRFETVTVREPGANVEERMAIITEPLDHYTKPTRWGAPVVPPAPMVQLLYQKSVEAMRGKLAPAVGLFGAIELRNINGPVQVDRDYLVSGEVIAVGQSPKTEYMWFESALDDTDGKRIAEMRMLLRFMKASSPVYQ